MKNVLLDKLMKDLSSISSAHDNCLDEAILLYGKQEYQYTDLEQTINKSVSIENTPNNKIEIPETDISDEYFREEYDNNVEVSGTTNSLLIETYNDIEF